MTKQLLFISLCFISFFGHTQDSLFVDLSSPYGSIRTHLFYLQDEHYDEIKAAQPFIQSGVSEELAIKTAIQLKQAWDGEGTYITMETIPKDPNYRDSIRNRNQYIINEKNYQISRLTGRSYNDLSWIIKLVFL